MQTGWTSIHLIYDVAWVLGYRNVKVGTIYYNLIKSIPQSTKWFCCGGNHKIRSSGHMTPHETLPCRVTKVGHLYITQIRRLVHEFWISGWNVFIDETWQGFWYLPRPGSNDSIMIQWSRNNSDVNLRYTFLVIQDNQSKIQSFSLKWLII